MKLGKSMEKPWGNDAPLELGRLGKTRIRSYFSNITTLNMSPKKFIDPTLQVIYLEKYLLLPDCQTIRHRMAVLGSLLHLQSPNIAMVLDGHDAQLCEHIQSYVGYVDTTPQKMLEHHATSKTAGLCGLHVSPNLDYGGHGFHGEIRGCLLLGGGYMWANLRFLGDKQFTTGWWFGS